MLPAGGALACDPLDPSACLYPWPNDHFTRADPTSPTGKRLALQDDWMPKNRFGKPVSAAPYNWSVDFDTYAHGDLGGTGSTPLGLYEAYPNELERPLLLSLIQLLWDAPRRTATRIT